MDRNGRDQDEHQDGPSKIRGAARRQPRFAMIWQENINIPDYAVTILDTIVLIILYITYL